MLTGHQRVLCRGEGISQFPPLGVGVHALVLGGMQRRADLGELVSPGLPLAEGFFQAALEVL